MIQKEQQHIDFRPVFSLQRGGKGFSFREGVKKGFESLRGENLIFRTFYWNGAFKSRKENGNPIENGRVRGQICLLTYNL